MIGWTTDTIAAHLCRGVDGLFGAFPASCQVNGGRPFLYLVAALLFALVVAVSFVLKRRRAA